VLHVDRRDVPAAIVSTPTGDDFPAAVDQKRGTITVTATQVPGNYTVRAGGDIGGITKGFSVNLPPAATDFSRLPADALAAVLGPGHRLAKSADEIVRDVNRERVGTELFPWVIVLVALAMAADWIAANRFYAPRERADGERAAAAEFAAEAAPAGTAASVPPLPSAPPLPPSAPPPVPPPEVPA